MRADPLWAIGTYTDADGQRAPWRISGAEINRDIGAATKILGELGVADKGVLWCSMLAEAGQFWPYICGTVLAGGRLSCADASEGEATRVAMFTRLLDYHAVFGVTDAILDGLDNMRRPYEDVFGRVPLVGAHPGAYERLRAQGVPAARFCVCGPAVALPREPEGDAFVADDEWELGVSGDRICVSARRERAQQFDRTPTHVSGRIVDRGVTW